MQTIPFSDKEVELAHQLHDKGIYWRPKSSDWFIDLSNLRVLYNGEYEQSVSLCLVLDEDGRSFSYLELIIDGEENGNRMKRSTSYTDKDKMANLIWLPAIKDCIDAVERNGDYTFISLEKIDNSYKTSIKDKSSDKIISCLADTELESFYSAIISL
ncbi:hypothetical protein EON78_01495 [bacterium]|nr:MAG: hypothetical protein EON78_01495 [bacterium]